MIAAASPACPPMMTADQQRAICKQQGTPPDACEEFIRNATVNGVFCDGTIVTDASGRRCVPQCVVLQKLAIEKVPPQPMSQNTKIAIAVGGGILAIGLVYFLVR